MYLQCNCRFPAPLAPSDCSFANEEFRIVDWPTIQKMDDGDARRAKFLSQKRALKEAKIASGLLPPTQSGQPIAGSSRLMSDVAGPMTSLLDHARQLLSSPTCTIDAVEMLKGELSVG